MVNPQLQVDSYQGPECPRCHSRLTADWIRTGIVRCPDCNRDFESTAFTPPTRRLRVEHVATGPVEANACANHGRNAAVTSCQRCGLLICALCDMNVGAGSYCPLCFDRVRAEGSVPGLAGKTRDYGAMARVSAIAGFLFLFMFIAPVLGIMALVYQAKGRKQQRARGDKPWTVGAVVLMAFAILEIAGGVAIDALMIGAMTGAFK